ncbi:uncharacterized protein LOC114440705 [Parambassis ranga]|uniref:Uncharacterized protein LOC114440705 n=1 Tax=Parambassis ranga TaxID=210632 RepID=A0A6P7IW27_9TELE|nr:uncharacterized protein LOC114440705 [Parambassis ranga]XP_028268937.1 uncharacterized protein LOC114440705 [Parambassis ranga]XP_028268938.1 uncharacterized protein LOC114440705 [Parambassis ranga]
MPLFRGDRGGRAAKAQPGQKTRRKRRVRDIEWMGSCKKTDEDGTVFSLTQLCLLSLADNMKEVWVKDYADNFMDHYSFRYIMGPFNTLPGELVEELIWLLCTRKQLTRAALHLLLLPQLRCLSLERCPGLVTPSLCFHITARCQGLWNLDLSGAQQLPSKALSETISSLSTLCSLSIAGTGCDSCVINAIVHCCRLLRHLDVSCCHLLSPAALLPLGGGTPCSSSDSPSVSPSSSPALSPLPLRSLLALDIGFGEEDRDAVFTAAYLLLSLPCLERLAMEGLSEACCLIDHREFSQTDEFTNREGVPSLDEVWRERRLKQGRDCLREKTERAANKKDSEKERTFWEENDSDSEEDASRDEGPSCSQNQAVVERKVLSQSGVILQLRDVKGGVTCETLDSLGCLCPDIHSISVVAEDTRGRSQGSLLTAGLQAWSGQLQSLSVQYLGALVDLLPALQVTGSSLVSLTLEGVRTSPHTPILEVIRVCPRLRDLLISAEPPSMPQQEEDGEVDQQEDGELPRLPNLRSLTLTFSYEHSQMMPAMSWMSLKRALKCLLTGSPLLEKLSLVSLPCPLNCILLEELGRRDLNLHHFTDAAVLPPIPLARVEHVDLLRTDVTMTAVKRIMQRSKRLKHVDVRYCWQITQLEWSDCKICSDVNIMWN